MQAQGTSDMLVSCMESEGVGDESVMGQGVKDEGDEGVEG